MTTHHSRSWFTPALAALTLVLGACGMFKKDPVPEPRISSPETVRDVPTPLRGTIGAEARVIGNESTLVSGIGFVVGLNGTGGLPMPETYAATLNASWGSTASGSPTTRPIRR